MREKDGAVGTDWLTKAILRSMLDSYMYVTRVRNGWLGCNAMVSRGRTSEAL